MQPTILLIEDDENDILFAQTALETAGVSCPIYVTTNGREAVDYLDGQGKYCDRREYPIPYLILLDLKLPYVMGLEILKRIREKPEFDKSIVIVLTASNDPKDIDTAYRLHANAYLVKPSGVEALNTLARSIKEFWFTLNQPFSEF